MIKYLKKYTECKHNKQLNFLSRNLKSGKNNLKKYKSKIELFNL